MKMMDRLAVHGHVKSALSSGVKRQLCQFHWPSSMKRRSAAAQFLGSRARILLRTWMYCVVYVAASATSWSLAEVSANECLCVSGFCDLEILTMRRPRPELACCVTQAREGGGIVLEAVNLTDFASGFLRQISKLGFTYFAVLFCFTTSFVRR